MSIRMRVLPRFPASVSGSNGITVVKTSGSVDLVVQNAYDQMIRIPSVINPDSRFLLVWNEDDNSYSIMSFTDTFVAALDIAGLMQESVYDPQGKHADAFARANHTGTQAQSTIINLVSDLATITSNIALKVDKATAGFGQCRLTLSGGNLLLSRFNGQWLMINGAMQSIPSAGVTLAATGLTVGTLYYIYAYMNSGTMTLEASTTTHATDATLGIEIKSGDATRTLVGMARPITGPAWADSISQRFVRSWFNRKPEAMRKAFTAIRSTTSLSFTEINTEIRCEWLQWADEVPQAHIQGTAANVSSNIYTVTAIGWDGTPDANTSNSITSATGLFVNCSTSAPKEGLSEGYHYATLMGAVSAASTGQWTSGISGVFTSLSARIGQ